MSKLKVKLLPHEKQLLESQELVDITHAKSTSKWLHADSSTPLVGFVNVYRVMGDIELLYLLEHHQLPATQPYQAIVEGEEGRRYMEKYLTGQKHVDTSPTTVIEFTIRIELKEYLFRLQHKIEDGVLSMGLGDKAGNGLIYFNEDLAKGFSSFRIVKVKRSVT
jgi:hypothetical protein